MLIVLRFRLAIDEFDPAVFEITPGGRMCRWAFVAVSLLSLLLLGPALGENAPSQLMRKSIQLSWTDARVERLESGRRVTMNQTSKVKLYVSDMGRIFSQFNRSVDRGGGGQSRKDMDISGSSGRTLIFHAEGNTLIADQISTGGARRVTVTFSEDFTTCSINVIHGKSGARTRHRDLANTQWLELLSIKVTSTSCNVTSGNVFGQ